MKFSVSFEGSAYRGRFAGTVAEPTPRSAAPEVDSWLRETRIAWNSMPDKELPELRDSNSHCGRIYRC